MIDLIRRNIIFARAIATYIDASPSYDLLNPTPRNSGGNEPIIPLNIVLFAPSSESKIGTGAELADAINATRKMYVTGTKWRGRGAVRLAISNWRTGLGGEEEVRRIENILEEVMR
jgi:glutamate/tyrosine decarboxylase-like PLP-dependent enzyme